MGTQRIRGAWHRAAAFCAALLLAVGPLPALTVAAHTTPGFAGTILVAHNQERMRLGLASLSWNPRLADEAARWAEKLAQEGRLEHSNRQQRSGTGENLWMGTAGYYSTDHMIGAFTREKALFVAGRFPDVSLSGRWQDVGHYTQMIWPETREVGCAMAEAHGRDIMVCRYWPAGNWVGQPVG